MARLGLTAGECGGVLRLLAFLLKLGNVQFEPTITIDGALATRLHHEYGTRGGGRRRRGGRGRAAAADSGLVAELREACALVGVDAAALAAALGAPPLDDAEGERGGSPALERLALLNLRDPSRFRSRDGTKSNPKEPPCRRGLAGLGGRRVGGRRRVRRGVRRLRGVRGRGVGARAARRAAAGAVRAAVRVAAGARQRGHQGGGGRAGAGRGAGGAAPTDARVLQPAEAGRRRSLGILDVYGFEALAHNGLERLLINYAAERLQAHVTHATLRREQDEYAREQLAWLPLAYREHDAAADLLDAGPDSVLGCLREAGARGGAGLLPRLQRRRHPLLLVLPPDRFQ